MFRKGQVAHNKKNRTNQRYGKLIALKDEGNGRWWCRCDCGNEVSVLSTNLANMAKNNRGCKHCAHRQDITGEKKGLLTAVECEVGPVQGRHPLWTFLCDCGNTLQGTVREFRAEWLRSCGCHGNAYKSWRSMLDRCYNPDNNRYQYYGGRGIKVCPRWQGPNGFNNFLTDMGECPKRHSLSRCNAEGGYEPKNCQWEHVSKNTADTCYGVPTRSGMLKGAKLRKYI